MPPRRKPSHAAYNGSGTACSFHGHGFSIQSGREQDVVGADWYHAPAFLPLDLGCSRFRTVSPILYFRKNRSKQAYPSGVGETRKRDSTYLGSCMRWI